MANVEHLSREEILLLLDGELEPKQAVVADEHIAGCAACRSLYLSCKQTLGDMQDLQAVLDARIHAEQRDRLRATVAREQIWRIRFGIGVTMAAGLLLITSISMFLGRHATPAAYLEDRPVPDRALTPGEVRSVDISDICRAGDDDLDPAVPAELQRAVFAEYKVPEQARAREFQVDYLINPQLGGTSDVKNLWPQPYTSIWNAQAKDMLEQHLRQMVCGGQMTLSEAQHELSEDWIQSYKRIFRTETPIPTR